MRKPILVLEENSFEFYTLMIYSDDSGWFDPNYYDDFEYPHEDFKFSGKCYQLTHQHGTFDLDTAIEAMDSLMKKISDKFPRYTEVAIVRETRNLKIEPIRKVTRYA